MTNKPQIRVSHSFSASAERVYDAFLDPTKARQFLFSTPTGQIVRCEIDARVGGRFSIVDRRDGEDVEHIGEYLTLERPRCIVFRMAVPKYTEDTTTVHIEISPLPKGCELTLTQEMEPKYENSRGRAQSGWASILALADAALQK